MGLMTVGAGGISACLNAKKLQYFYAAKNGLGSSFTLNFPAGLKSSCWFVGIYWENAPKDTGINSFRIINCESSEITTIERIQSTQYVLEFRFLAKVTGANEKTAFYSDTLTPNDGSNYRVYGAFLWD